MACRLSRCLQILNRVFASWAEATGVRVVARYNTHTGSASAILMSTLLRQVYKLGRPGPVHEYSVPRHIPRIMASVDWYKPYSRGRPSVGNCAAVYSVLTVFLLFPTGQKQRVFLLCRPLRLFAPHLSHISCKTLHLPTAGRRLNACKLSDCARTS